MVRLSLCAIVLSLLVAGSAWANVNCGIPPLPPLGCKAVCYCDSTGVNCWWEFVCG